MSTWRKFVIWMRCRCCCEWHYRKDLHYYTEMEARRG